MSRRKVRIRRTAAEATYYALQIDAAQRRMATIHANPTRRAVYLNRQAETAAPTERREGRRAS
jgi:hypothetical protein